MLINFYKRTISNKINKIKIKSSDLVCKVFINIMKCVLLQITKSQRGKCTEMKKIEKIKEA